jgi:hypothetical protein
LTSIHHAPAATPRRARDGGGPDRVKEGFCVSRRSGFMNHVTAVASQNSLRLRVAADRVASRRPVP